MFCTLLHRVFLNRHVRTVLRILIFLLSVMKNKLINMFKLVCMANSYWSSPSTMYFDHHSLLHFNCTNLLFIQLQNLHVSVKTGNIAYACIVRTRKRLQDFQLNRPRIDGLSVLSIKTIRKIGSMERHVSSKACYVVYQNVTPNFQFLVIYPFSRFLLFLHTLETYYLPFLTNLDFLNSLATMDTARLRTRGL